MKKRFLKIFNSESEYLTLKDEVMKIPYVVYLKDSKSVKYSGKLPSVVDYSKEYFTIEALENELTVTLSRNASEYCIDNGEWISLSANTASPSINSGQTISFRMENPTISSSYGIGTFTINKKCNVKGNIMSLLYAEDFEGQTDLSGMNDVFKYLFYNCVNLVNAKDLVLPATTLAKYCYSNMFEGCKSLTTAPSELPATTLAKYCYDSMFESCTSLTTAPELKATTLNSMCYYQMFSACKSLTTAPQLPATTLASGCYERMFEGCKSLTTAPQLPATTLASGCYERMFQGCTSLTTAPELPATTLINSCYSNMFYNTNVLPDCSNIDFTSASVVASGGLEGLFAGTKVTDSDLMQILPLNDEGKYCLPATNLATSCYKHMFDACKSLTTAPELPATTLANSCYSTMFNGCTSLTTAPQLPATTLAEWCYGSMFNGCTSLTSAPELPATTLANYCYYYMFEDCTSLTTAPELPATTLAKYCYQYMFNGCTSLTTAPQLPATTLAYGCYNSMFNGCTSLTSAPELLATTLADYCYYQMFNGCSKLNYIKMLATNISANGCLLNWVIGVASSGTFVKNANMTTLPSGASGIPSGWTVNNISPCIINQASESITFVYSDGLFTPTNEIIDLSQHFTKDELLSVQPECEIIVTLLDKTDNVLASDYVWANDKTLGDVLNELGVTKDVYDINVIITNVNAPEDNGYYYYYMLDETEPFVEKDWMRVVSLEDDNTISLSKDIQYSVNGDDWRNLYANNTITVNSDDIIYFKGTNTENHFTVSKAFNAEGNIMSLIYGGEFEGQIDLSGKDYIFRILFSNCTTLQNAKDLVLPATTLASGCYTNMFAGCTSLTTAPELPATTLAQSCYYRMFAGCTSLTTAPELPATKLATSCYDSMFYGTNVLPDCSNIDFTSASVVASGGLKALFAGTKVTDADLERILPKNDEGKYYLPATTLANYCYDSMFQGCTSLTTAPELPATTLANDCYNSMFSGCTSLTTAPELLATRLAERCYEYMFQGCTSLTKAPSVLPAITLAFKCYSEMFKSCTSLTTTPELKATTLATSCYYGMFEDCILLTTAPELKATKLSMNCYYNMFKGCGKLNYIKMLATNISASYCLDNWVIGVSSNGTFVKNANMTSLPSGVSGIPDGWTVENA